MVSTRYATRLIVLGASNVRRSLFSILEVARAHFRGPIDFLIVAGHGRSYGVPNRVLGWSLPGISESDWSRHWHRADTAARFAIITDVGNDLLFGNDSKHLCHWVRTCIEEVSSADRVLLTGLPIERSKRVGAIQFSIFRKIFFPRSRASLEEILEGANYVDTYLRELAQQRACAWFEPSSQWYGYDPIHVKRRYLSILWKEMMNRLIQSSSESLKEASIGPPTKLQLGDVPRCELRWRERFRLVFSRANRQSWFGATQDCAQPFLDLQDGSSVSFY